MSAVFPPVLLYFMMKEEVWVGCFVFEVSLYNTYN